VAQGVNEDLHEGYEDRLPSDFGACADGDQALLARQLDRLLGDGQTWGRQSANAYRYFQREHDIEPLLPAFARSLLSLRSR
jgi:hypothetical protein